MALLGQAALAMWWDMSAGMKPEFEDWHSHEHFPERLGIPGFLRSSRWCDASGGTGVFVLYELENHAVLSSPAYLQRLNNPTPWSRKLMPHHKNMMRSQSHVLASWGGLTAKYATTLRFVPGAIGDVTRFCSAARAVLEGLAARPGVAGAHFLKHEAPPIEQTIEQKIRGVPDQCAEFVLLVTAYDETALSDITATDLSSAALRALGARELPANGYFALSHSALPADVR